MIRILEEAPGLKTVFGVYIPSVSVTLAPTPEKVELITSLKQLSFLNTNLSWAVIVEIGAAIGVAIMLINYSFVLYRWLRGRRG